jgi:hypothetical protein
MEVRFRVVPSRNPTFNLLGTRMKSPITVLWGNIIHAFENCDEASLRMHLNAVTSGLVNREIDYDNGPGAAIPPHADLSSRRIYLQEVYLEHLWALIYSVFVMYEEGVQKPLINNTFTGAIEFETYILRRAKALYDWSLSLSSERTPWNLSLPNPASHSNETEKGYAEKTNAIFQRAAAYVLYHEWCHLTHGHDSYYVGVNTSDLTEADYADRIQIENEADTFAFNMIVGAADDENTRWINGLSILFVKCSSLVLTASVHGIKQRSHADLDSRLHATLDKLDLKSGHSRFYCWYLGCLAIEFYLLKHGKKRTPKVYETAEECFFAYLEQLDLIKAGVNTDEFKSET